MSLYLNIKNGTYVTCVRAELTDETIVFFLKSGFSIHINLKFYAGETRKEMKEIFNQTVIKN